MSINTDIQYSDSTINPTSGCDGCEIFETCYARPLHERRFAKTMPEKYAADFREVRMIPGRMAEAAKWSNLRGVERKHKPWIPRELPRLIFISDMSDALSKAVTFDYLKSEIIDVVSKWPHIGIWITKQTARMEKFDSWLAAQGIPWPDNLWAITSVTNQNTANKRIPHLLRMRAKVLGLSVEPMKGRIDFSSIVEERGDSYGDGAVYLNALSGERWMRDGIEKDLNSYRALNWVILGLESGAKSCLGYVYDIEKAVEQLTAASVPVFVKQLGSKPIKAVVSEPFGDEDEAVSIIAGNLPLELKDSKGGDWSEWPVQLRIRNYPTVGAAC